MNYKYISVSDLITDIHMGPFGSDVKKEYYDKTGIPILNGSNLTGFELDDSNLRFFNIDQAKKLSNCFAKPDDIIITHRGTLGQVVFVPQTARFKCYLISQSQFLVRCNKEIILPEYLTYYLHSKNGQWKLLSNVSQVGVPSLARPTSTFKKLKIPVPPIEIQKRIVEKIKNICHLISINSKINDYLSD